MTTDRIAMAIAKARERQEPGHFHQRYVTALDVTEAARFVYDLRDDRHYDANEGAYLVGERSLAKLQHAINAWADAVLGSKQP